ncbi:MAG: FliH/SctL family protein [Candidatus Gastranaerophilales bacterium]|nr:FliH/SctL family protein [Candidatus Gastranaerophilales bacterium]
MSRIRLEDVEVGHSYVIKNTSANKLSESISEEVQQENTAVAEAELEAHNIISAAHQKSARIIEEAQKTSQESFNQSKEEGMKAGYDAGYKNGVHQIQADFINQIKSVDIIAKSAFNVKKEIIISAEQELLLLAVTIAEKIVRQQLEIHPETILNIVKAAINQLQDKEEVKIIVNPAVTNYLYEFSDELKQSINGLEKIKIIEDRTVPLEGVIVESLDSRIDARLDSQITEITKKIMKESAEHPVMEEIPKEIEIKIEEP